MGEQSGGKVGVDRRVYVANRSKFLPQDLLPYAGQWVAWSADGSRVVAHDGDLHQVDERVRAAGLDPEDVVLECLPEAEDFEARL